jgi:hypothetical protein
LYQGVSEPYGSAFRLPRYPRDPADRRLRRARSYLPQIPYVFHRNGRPIRSYHVVWWVACKRAAVAKCGNLETVIRPHLRNRTPHDFRRTARGISAGRAYPARRHEALRVEDRRDVSPVCDRGRTRPSSRGGITGEGDNRGTSGGEVRPGGGMSFANSLHCKCPGRDSNPHGVAPKGF